MNAVKTILKIVTALAAVAGIIYLIATYGDKIVAWAKNLLQKCPCCGGCDCDCDCDGNCDECECECECEVVEAPVEEAPVEEVPAEEAPAEEAVAAEAPAAEEADFAE
jgi:hypothetical protein